jgi:hypothetical protein
MQLQAVPGASRCLLPLGLIVINAVLVTSKASRGSSGGAGLATRGGNSDSGSDGGNPNTINPQP